jgi:hypothetical protein
MWKFFTFHISLFTCVSATVFDMLEQKEKLVQIHERDCPQGRNADG